MSEKNKKCRICRRANQKLHLKGEKCFSPKCTFIKKSYAPGKKGLTKRRVMLTEYGVQLREKQKVRNSYNLSEKQFSNYVKKSINKKGSNPKEMLYEFLESRLDNVVFRLGWATSRALARQIVSHGHIVVNGRKLNIPSYQLKIEDVVGIRPQSKTKPLFEGLSKKVKKQADVPAWVKADNEKLEGKMTTTPKVDKGDITFNLATVLEFYSR